MQTKWAATSRGDIYIYMYGGYVLYVLAYVYSVGGTYQTNGRALEGMYIWGGCLEVCFGGSVVIMLKSSLTGFVAHTHTRSSQVKHCKASR
jgi:hypothetical protein